MTNIQSQKQIIQNTSADIYEFLMDFNNFETMLPPQISNWQSDAESCSFNIEGMAEIALKMGVCTKPNQVIYISTGKSPLSFDLITEMKELDGKCECQISMNADLNPFLKILAEKPLTNFVNLLVTKLKELKDQS